MIVCPSCDKENADESVHCGFCGHQLQEGGKKTMFGMAALNAGDIKAAAQAAKQAAAAAGGAGPKLNLPSPGGLGGVAGGGGTSDDASAKTEVMSSISGNTPAQQAAAPAQQPAAPDPFADDFAALEQQFGDDPSFESGVDEPPVDPTPMHTHDAFGAPSSPGLSGMSASSGSSAPTQPHQQPNMQSNTPPHTQPHSNPSNLNITGPATGGMQQGPPQHGEVERKKPKTAFFVIGGIVLLFMMIGCASGALAIASSMGMF